MFRTFQWLWKAVGENLQNYSGFPKLIGECGGKNFHFVHPTARQSWLPPSGQPSSTRGRSALHALCAGIPLGGDQGGADRDAEVTQGKLNIEILKLILDTFMSRWVQLLRLILSCPLSSTGKLSTAFLATSTTPRPAPTAVLLPVEDMMTVTVYVYPDKVNISVSNLVLISISP